MGSARPWVPMLGALGLVALLAGCGMSRQAGAAVDAGRQATKQGDLLSALEHYRTATRLAPDSATAQLALGEAAEALGEFNEALSAYQAAARRPPSTTTWLRLGEMTDRTKWGGWTSRSRGSSKREGRGVGTPLVLELGEVSDLSVSSKTAGLVTMMVEPLRVDAACRSASNSPTTSTHGSGGSSCAIVLNARNPDIEAQAEPRDHQERMFLDAQTRRDARHGPTPRNV